MFSIQPEQYDILLQEKTERIKQLFSQLYNDAIDVYSSEKSHYRMRAEFRLWRQDNQLHYAMFEKGKKNMPVFIEDFPQAHTSINKLMFPLLERINATPLLAARLFQIDFLTTKAGDVLVTLIYHRNLTDEWEAMAKTLEEQFKIKIVGRARKQKRILSTDYVTETLIINEQKYKYKQIENSFSQPNALVCEKMIEWTLSNITMTNTDLLELYCGNGNFTLPLSSKFRKILATEVSKSSIKAAKDNCLLNDIDNINFVRLSSNEVSQAFAKEREFRRLAETPLEDYQFETVFVDPPRAGLDTGSIELVTKFNTILYISCNPETLKENVEQLSEYKIEKLALFDQFPYTDHVECGAVLKKR